MSFILSENAGYEEVLGSLAVTPLQKERLRFFFQDYLEMNSRILELGGSDGWLGNYLRDVGFRGYRRMNPDGPAGTTGRWSTADFAGDVRDWRNLGIGPGSFDFIVAFDILQHIDCLSECFDLLAPGGRLLVIAPIPGREWISRLLSTLRLRPSPPSPSSRTEDFRHLRGFRLVSSRTESFVERWAVLRKPIEATS
jgi:SAM-dependent methyltransferase